MASAAHEHRQLRVTSWQLARAGLAAVALCWSAASASSSTLDYGPLQSELDAQRATWIGAGPSDYSYREDTDAGFDASDVRVRVREGEVAQVRWLQPVLWWAPEPSAPPEVDDFLTVEALFERIQGAIDGEFEQVDVSYDGALGHPSSVLLSPVVGSPSEASLDYSIADLMHGECLPKLDALDDARALWWRYSVRFADYEYRYWHPFNTPPEGAFVEVRSFGLDVTFLGERDPVVPASSGLQGMEPLFDGLELNILEGGQMPPPYDVTYDGELGYPTLIAIRGAPLATIDQFASAAVLRRRALDEARLAWKAAGIRSYSYVLHDECRTVIPLPSCSVPDEAPARISVRDGEIDGVTDRESGAPLPIDGHVPIDGLFDRLAGMIDREVWTLEAHYDRENGHPKSVFRALDTRFVDVAGFRTSDFQLPEPGAVPSGAAVLLALAAARRRRRRGGAAPATRAS